MAQHLETILVRLSFAGNWGERGICRGWLNLWHIWYRRKIPWGFPDSDENIVMTLSRNVAQSEHFLCTLSDYCSETSDENESQVLGWNILWSSEYWHTDYIFGGVTKPLFGYIHHWYFGETHAEQTHRRYINLKLLNVACGNLWCHWRIIIKELEKHHLLFWSSGTQVVNNFVQNYDGLKIFPQLFFLSDIECWFLDRRLF